MLQRPLTPDAASSFGASRCLSAQPSDDFCMPCSPAGHCVFF